VAFLSATDAHHEWAVHTFRKLRTPLVTCEAVIAETTHLLRASHDAQDKVLEWVGRGTLVPDFDLTSEGAAVRRLMRRYKDVPMSLADACLVRLAEIHDDHAVVTLDADFRVYRKDGRAPVPLVAP
jgi:predicted nucleic acid-binding protein